MVGRETASHMASASTASVLPRLYVGLHIGRRDQSNVMADGLDLACPEVRSPAGFKANNAAPQAGKELKHVGAAKPPLDRYLAIRRHAVNLEYQLANIEPDYCSFDHGTTSSFVIQS